MDGYLRRSPDDCLDLVGAQARDAAELFGRVVADAFADYASRAVQFNRVARLEVAIYSTDADRQQ